MSTALGTDLLLDFGVLALKSLLESFLPNGQRPIFLRFGSASC